MRVFVTGATGLVGSAVVQDLLQAGHQVIGLARSDANVQALTRAGAQAHRGSLDDQESIAAAVHSCDGVIHLAMKMDDLSDVDGIFAADRRTIATIGTALAGSGRPFIVTTGTMLLAPGKVGTEEDAASPASPASFRVQSENEALAWASRGVRVCVVRLAPSVHGPGDDHGFIPMLIAAARRQGHSLQIGEGLNRWPAVHRRDAAPVFRLALEKGVAGARYHAAGDEGIPFRDIAATIGRRLNLPVIAQSAEEAAASFGWLGHVYATDNPVSSTLTRERLGWRPVHPGLLADLEDEHYFRPVPDARDAAALEDTGRK